MLFWIKLVFMSWFSVNSLAFVMSLLWIHILALLFFALCPWAECYISSSLYFSHFLYILISALPMYEYKYMCIIYVFESKKEKMLFFLLFLSQVGTVHMRKLYIWQSIILFLLLYRIFMWHIAVQSVVHWWGLHICEMFAGLRGDELMPDCELAMWLSTLN